MGKQSKAETLPAGAAVASAKYVRMGPRKVRRVVDIIRGMKTEEALTTLQFSPWRACAPVSKVVRSAVANAEHNKRLDPGALWISEAYVDQGPSLRRWRPRAQGRAYPVHKHTSHITVVVEERVDEDEETPTRRRRRDRRAEAKEQKSAKKAAQRAADEADEAAADADEAKPTEAKVDDEPTEPKKKAAAKKTTAKKTTASEEAAGGDEPAKTAAKKKAAEDEPSSAETDDDQAARDATEGESS